nr:MAG TPA: hypothetical protein [Bacteriophage sp.]DAR41953.1 MAG TPA: hypothetical protein [Bacteriophage sp.]
MFHLLKELESMQDRLVRILKDVCYLVKTKRLEWSLIQELL